MSNTERTGWRDEKLSRRHREWGKDILAFDIDFIMVESNYERAVALIEYKNQKARINLDSWPNKILSGLATDAGLPAFLVIYAGDFSWWRVWPLNELGFKKITRIQFESLLSEDEYVDFLRGLRTF